MQNILVHIMVCTYLMLWICYSQSVSLIAFPIDFCMHDKTCVVILNTIKTLLQFQHSKLGQILHVDKTYFLRPPVTFTITIHICIQGTSLRIFPNMQSGPAKQAHWKYLSMQNYQMGSL